MQSCSGWKNELQLKPVEGFGPCWGQSKAELPENIIHVLCMATTKAPQTRAEDATKIQQQLEKHPHIWIWKAEQPKSVNSLNSALVFCTLKCEFLCGMDEFIQSSLVGWIPVLCLFWSTCCSETNNLYKCSFDKAGGNLCGLEQNPFQLWGNFSCFC